MFSTSEIGARIKLRREQLGLTLEDIATQVEVARSTIQRYEAGSIARPKLPVLHSISRALNVSPDWLLGISDNMFDSTSNLPSNILPLPKMRSVPLLGTIACGEPILAEENVEGFLAMPESVNADFALRCKGDSMINARIFDGDIVYIRQQPTVEDGQIAAVLIDNEATLKRVHLYPDHISLEPENPQFRPIVKWGEEMSTVRILGKAVAFTSAVR